jgi:hypothetical protein
MGFHTIRLRGSPVTWLTPSRASNWSAQKLGLSRSQPFSAGKRLAFYYRDLYETLTGKSLTLCPVSYRAHARHRNPAKAERSPVRLGFVMTGSGLPMSNRLVSPRRTGVVVLIPCHAERRVEPSLLDRSISLPFHMARRAGTAPTWPLMQPFGGLAACVSLYNSHPPTKRQAV